MCTLALLWLPQQSPNRTTENTKYSLASNSDAYINNMLIK